MTRQEAAQRVITDALTREVYLSALHAEMRKVGPRNRNAPENAPARIEARAWDQALACIKALQERAA